MRPEACTTTTSRPTTPRTRSVIRTPKASCGSGVSRPRRGRAGKVQEPKIDLGNPQITSLTLTGARLALPLKIANVNRFPLPLGGILGTVDIAGATVGRIAMPEAAPVPSNGETTVSIPLNVSFLQTGAAVAQALRSGVAEVKVDAILNAAGASIPVKVARTVELQRTTGSAGG